MPIRFWPQSNKQVINGFLDANLFFFLAIEVYLITWLLSCQKDLCNHKRCSFWPLVTTGINSIFGNFHIHAILHIKFRSKYGHCINFENVASGNWVNLGKLCIERVLDNLLSILKHFKFKGDAFNQANK